MNALGVPSYLVGCLPVYLLAVGKQFWVWTMQCTSNNESYMACYSRLQYLEV